MTYNKALANVNPKDAPLIEKVRYRLLRLKKRLKNWRAVGGHLGVHHVYAWRLALEGVVPPNPDTRRKLFLPRVLPSERKPKAKREPKPKVWENPDLYLRKVKP